MVDETEFGVMDVEELQGENWTREEIEELIANARELAESLDLDEEFAQTLVSRALDIRDNPDVFLTVEEFFEECDRLQIERNTIDLSDYPLEEECEESEESNGSASEA